MAKAKAKEIKEAPVLRAGGGGGGGTSFPIDRIIVKGKSCIASIEIDTNIGTISGYVDMDGEVCPFSANFF